MQYIERGRSMTSSNSRNMISMIQKSSAVFFIFLSTILLNSKRALPAAVPVIKSVKGWDGGPWFLPTRFSLNFVFFYSMCR
jgi:hypothetical protein